jgi:hypothetical protein
VPVDSSVAGSTAGKSSWKRDELILALEVYMRHRRDLPKSTRADVVNLSKELESFAEISSGGVPSSRSPGDVERKLESLARLDPSGSSYDLAAADEDEKEVWARFSGDEALLVRVSASIRAAIQRYGKGLLEGEPPKNRPHLELRSSTRSDRLPLEDRTAARNSLCLRVPGA